jgi:hypothetical protein
MHFEETQLVAHSRGYWDRVVKEAIAIRLEEKNFNRDTGFSLSKAWQPVLKTSKEKRRENQKFPAHLPSD